MQPHDSVAADLDAVGDRLAQLDEVVVQVGDPVVVEHGRDAVDLDQLVAGAQAVLDDEQRLLPAVPELVGTIRRPTGSICQPQALAGRVRVGHPAEDVALDRGPARGRRGLADAHVVAERHEVDGVREQLPVVVGDVQVDAVLAEVPQHVAGVGAAGVHVAEHQVAVVGLHHGDDVGGVGGQRVGRHRQDHAADLRTGHRLVRDPGGQGAGDQLVVDRLVQVARRQLASGVLIAPVMNGSCSTELISLKVSQYFTRDP